MDADDPRQQGLAAARAELLGATPRVTRATRPARSPRTSNADVPATAPPAVPDEDQHRRMLQRLAELEDEVTRLRAALDAIATRAAEAARNDRP